MTVFVVVVLVWLLVFMCVLCLFVCLFVFVCLFGEEGSDCMTQCTLYDHAVCSFLAC